MYTNLKIETSNDLSKQKYKQQKMVDITSIENNNLLTTLESLIEIYKKNESEKGAPLIPLSLFSNTKFGIIQVLVKFLKENSALTLSQIGRLLKRDARTIWTIYHATQRKQKRKFLARKEDIFIPCKIFADRRFSPLEILTLYLKEKYVLTLKEIARLLNREYQVIWLCYKNGIVKKGIRNE